MYLWVRSFLQYPEVLSKKDAYQGFWKRFLLGVSTLFGLSFGDDSDSAWRGCHERITLSSVIKRKNVPSPWTGRNLWRRIGVLEKKIMLPVFFSASVVSLSNIFSFALKAKENRRIIGSLCLLLLPVRSLYHPFNHCWWWHNKTFSHFCKTITAERCGPIDSKRLNQNNRRRKLQIQERKRNQLKSFLHRENQKNLNQFEKLWLAYIKGNLLCV